ncbi:catalytic [Ascochyta rabiei]|uniref:Catalytic n=1 Tax=Didymella rabiei TaxID=5454 RepID=A0A163JSZ8_DIDRA|nr:catalytic [Ascochyta rabiei]
MRTFHIAPDLTFALQHRLHSPLAIRSRLSLDTQHRSVEPLVDRAQHAVALAPTRGLPELIQRRLSAAQDAHG